MMFDILSGWVVRWDEKRRKGHLSKLKSPLLSLDAHGTVGKVITYQSGGGRKFARKKPELPYSLTLAQQYQRWQYEDYCRFWHTLTATQKAWYREWGSRHHQTAFQAFMGFYLRLKSDIVCGYRMDKIGGAVVPDFSPNAIDLTKFGATYVDGLIAEGLYFDGINDYLLSAYHPALNPGAEWSFTFFIKPESIPNWAYIITRNQLADKDNSFMILYFAGNKKIYFYIGDGVGPNSISLGPLEFGTWYPVTCGVDGSFLYMYVGDQQATPVAQTRTPIVSTNPLRIGTRSDGAFNFKGILDQVVLRSRLVSYQEHLIRAERRFSL